MAWMAPVAVAAQQKKEEAAMIQKIQNADPEGKYEYKIIRSEMNAFRNQDYLQEILDIESQGSWHVVEKIDNARVILRRPTSAQVQDIHLDTEYDPYRVNYGSGSVNVIAILLGLLVLVGSMFFLGYQVMQNRPELIRQQAGMPYIVFSVVLFLMIFLLFVKFGKK
jgi:hypothetical protein